jgi:hypothetical protein
MTRRRRAGARRQPSTPGPVTWERDARADGHVHPRRRSRRHSRARRRSLQWMVLEGSWSEEYCAGYATWEEAQAGHARTVSQLRGGTPLALETSPTRRRDVMRAIRRSALAVLAAVMVFGLSDAWAHLGGLNAQGCHQNRKTGDYHCHRTSTPPPVASSPPLRGTSHNAQPSANRSSLESGPVKKSSSGICHAPGSSYYQQTMRFTAYPSLEECLNSGGRPPKR